MTDLEEEVKKLNKKFDVLVNKVTKLERKISSSNLSKEGKIEFVLNTVLESGQVMVNELMNELGVSKRYTLDLMKEVSEKRDNIHFFKGSPHNPSKLRVLDDSKNKMELVPLIILQEMKGCKGETKTYSNIMNRYDLDRSECQEVVSTVIRTAGVGRLKVIGDGLDKRLKNIRW